MDIKDNQNNEPTDAQKESDKLPAAELKTKKEELNEEKPIKRIRKQATQKQLSNPLHGVKLAEILEKLVAHYGWEYLGERTNIRCFMYYPTMKSSLGFLRKTTWARVFVEDIYIEMIEKR